MKNNPSNHSRQVEQHKHYDKDLKHGYTTLVKEVSTNLGIRDRFYGKLFSFKPIEWTSRLLSAILQPLATLIALVLWLMFDLLFLLDQSTTPTVMSNLPIFYILLIGYIIGLAADLLLSIRGK